MEKKFISPISLIGTGALVQAGEELKKLKFKKGFIVISSTLSEKNILKNLTDVLKENNIEYHIYTRNIMEPDLDIINDGINDFSKNNCDFVISFGGRDTTKCAKGIAMGLKCYEENHTISCYINAEIPFMTVVINSWINDDNNVYSYHKHKVTLNKSINPFIVVMDSELIRNLPRKAMAVVGIDSLTHSVESIVSKGATPISDACAFQAIKILKNNLEIFIKGTNNTQIREQLTYANYLANMAFNNISAGEDQTERKDGFHTPAFDMEIIDSKMFQIANMLGLDSKNETPSIKIMEEIKRLSGLMEIEPNLRKNEKVIMKDD